MKKILRRNQLIITTLAALIAVAGYLNFTEKNDLERKNKMENKVVTETDVNAKATEKVTGEKSTGDAEESTDVNQANSDDIESNDQDVQSTPGEAIFVNASGTVDFIVEAKLSKEYMRATNSENLNEIIIVQRKE